MENRLEHIAEFQEVLTNYHVSKASQKILAATDLALFVGPTSAGRNTIISELLKTGKYHYIVSDTTRKMRMKDGQQIEQNGREYWFRSETEVLDELKRGEFIEAAIIHNQQVSGINIREVGKAHKAGRTAITDIEPNGAETIHNLKPDTAVIFVIPSGFEEWMKRLEGRGRMDEAEKHRRLETAIKEFEAALQKDYYTFVVNDSFDTAVEEAHRLIRQGEHEPARQELGRRVTEKLLQDTQKFLRR